MDTVVVPSLPWLRGCAGAISGRIVGGLSPTGAVWLSCKRVRQLLHDRLLARRTHTCVKYANNLHGQTTGWCPECGEPFDPPADP